MPNDRAESAYRFRVEAAELARNREHPKHEANADEARYGTACYPMSFTKGLEHDEKTGLVANKADFEAFRTAIDNGFAEPFTTRVPVPRELKNPAKPKEGFKPRRQWEAPTAGTVFELEGPDPQAVTMPPAPELGSDELTFEMAEVYELALLRDVPFTEFEGSGVAGAVFEAADRLNKLPYACDEFVEGRPRKCCVGVNAVGQAVYQLDAQTAFRGSSPGVEKGPYLSQLMLIGNSIKDARPLPEEDVGLSPKDGQIAYGAQSVSQKVLQAKVGDDYMMRWDDWLEVQRGFNPRTPGASSVSGQVLVGSPRLICTPRDLATYVHVDALYQAYLNACLLLLGHGAPFDPGFDMLSGMGDGVLEAPSSQTFTPYNAGGFALWGGPHILSLVTEVATRGLKAVRYQKFNTHLRLRPETLSGRIERADEIEAQNPSICGRLAKMRDDLSEDDDEETPKIVDLIRDYNDVHPNGGDPTALLPMAFEEGSPMHATYGAGHATVAGACVTILKAFFDTSAVFVRVSETGTGDDELNAGFMNKSQIIDELKESRVVQFGAYRAIRLGDADPDNPADSSLDFTPCGHFELQLSALGEKESPPNKDLVELENKYLTTKIVPDKPEERCCPLTLEGELNKLAANISIGRNMAGVHYFSDYFDSVRMGEEIAIGILEEQALGYKLDPFVMSVPTFDGDTVRIGRR